MRHAATIDPVKRQRQSRQDKIDRRALDLAVDPPRRQAHLSGLRQGRHVPPLSQRLRSLSCGEALHHHRADDAPPYFTIVIVGHVIVGLLLAVEMAYRPPLWLHAALWLPLTVLLALLLLPVIKGTLVGLQWALLMHGFDPSFKEESYDTFVGKDRGLTTRS